jgi:hypothetical protein
VPPAGLGAFVTGAAIASLAIVALGWPLLVTAMPVWARVTVEVAWVALLLAGMVAGRRAERHEPAVPASAPGPRDCAPQDEPMTISQAQDAPRQF